MEEQRKYSILFAATTLAARKLHEIGDKPRPARGVPSPTRLCCEQVDLLNNTVTLYSGETKNKEGRIVALTEECRFLVTDLRKGKQPEDFLFTRKGGSCPGLPRNLGHAHKESGIAGPAPAQFSAVIREEGHCHRGVPQKTARELGGCKTDAVFSRYNIVSEADIRDAAKKNRSRSQGRNAQFIHS